MIWSQLNITLYQLQLEDVSKQWFMPIRIGVRE